jgi:hypothetical protein
MYQNINNHMTGTKITLCKMYTWLLELKKTGTFSDKIATRDFSKPSIIRATFPTFVNVLSLFYLSPAESESGTFKTRNSFVQK